MNLYCDYTAQTNHKFYNTCCTQDDVVNYQGVCSQQKLNNILAAGSVNKWTQFFIPEIVDIPQQKPNMESVDSVYSCIEIISQRVVKTPLLADPTQSNWEGTNLTGRKLVIEGLLKQKVIYTANTSVQPLHSAHFAIPFSVFIIVDGTYPLTQKFRLDTCIEDIFTCRLSERSLFKNTTIFIKATPLC